MGPRGKLGRGEEWAQPASCQERWNMLLRFATAFSALSHPRQRHRQRRRSVLDVPSLTTRSSEALSTRTCSRGGGPDAGARRRRDTAFRCERQKKYRARLVSSARTHTLGELPPATTTDAQTSTDSRAVCELQTPSTHPRSTLPPHASLTHSHLTSTWQDSTWRHMSSPLFSFGLFL